jgi:uncharacterized membrane protein (UPF0136 family)
MLGSLLLASLSLLFLWRLRVILMNFARCFINCQRRWLMGFMPTVSGRPIKQLMFWAAELLVVLFIYDLFGLAFAAHIAAALVGFGVMFFLRERNPESNLLQNLQIMPLTGGLSLAA